MKNKKEKLKVSISFRNKYLLILGIMIFGYAILYPRLLHNMILYITGMSEQYKENTFIPPKLRTEQNNFGNENRFLSTKTDKNKIWTILIPLYGVGFLLYFLFYMNTYISSSQDNSECEVNEDELEPLFKPLTLESKYRWNGLSSKDIDYWRINDPKIERSEKYGVSKNDRDYSNKRNEIKHLLSKIQKGHCNMNEVNDVLMRLQDAEIELFKMMKSIHQLRTYTQCHKEALEDDEELGFRYSDSRFRASGTSTSRNSEYLRHRLGESNIPGHSRHLEFSVLQGSQYSEIPRFGESIYQNQIFNQRSMEGRKKEGEYCGVKEKQLCESKVDKLSSDDEYLSVDELNSD